MKKILGTGLILSLILNLVLLSMPTFISGQVNAQENPPTWDSTLGWDFEDHGYTHAHFGRLTEAQIRDEEAAVNDAFEGKEYPPPRHIAYPYGDYDDTVESVVSEYRDTGRMVWGQMMPYPVANWYEMKAAQLKKTTPWKKITAWVDECVETQSLLHILTHDVSSSPSVYGCTTNMLTQLLDYLVEQQEAGDLKVMTMAEAYDTWSEGDPGIATVVISFDDANESDYITVYPLFKERGLKGTSYITVSFIETPGHLTWDDIDNMRNSVNQPPIADAGGDQTIIDADGDNSEIVTLDASGSYDPDGSIMSYDWYIDGNVILDHTEVVTPTFSVGSHTATLEVTDNDGAKASDSITITVSPAASGDTMTVDSISCRVIGGKHLITNATVVDSNQLAASGATVTIDLFQDGNPYITLEGITGADGAVQFKVLKAPAGEWYAKVSNVSQPDMTWDGIKKESNLVNI